MFFTVVSPKFQTTLGLETRKMLGLKPGTRLKQTVENGKVIIEPIDDVMTAFGSLASDGPVYSIREETEGMEAAIAQEVAAKARRD